MGHSNGSVASPLNPQVQGLVPHELQAACDHELGICVSVDTLIWFAMGV